MKNNDWIKTDEQKEKRTRHILVITLCVVTIVAVTLFLLGFPEKPFPAFSSSPSSSVSDNSVTIPNTSGLHVYFIDVGQGDCTLLISPNGKTMLIDAGGVHAFSKIRYTLDKLSIERIDVAICTHMHEDHIGGMAEVVEHFPVGQMFLSPYDIESASYAHLIDVINDNHVPASSAYAGLNALIDWDELCEVRILSPYETHYTDENDTSMIVRVKFGNNAVLITGDAGETAEYLALKALPHKLFHADVLKVAHHGSRTATSKKFLNRVNPSIAVISVGNDNPYGLPDEEILARLEETGTRIYRTDRDGTVLITLDGVNATVVE